ncbi:MAG: YcxB family protein [Clostridia bacterium]|nr:YcxB family protein [Clostridia bacterium]
MKLLYIVNTKHDEAAYRAYAKVHMDGRVTPLGRVIAAAGGLVIAAGGVLAIVNKGFNLLHPVTILLGAVCMFAYPLGLWRMCRRLLKHAQDLSMNIDYRFGDDAFSVAWPGRSDTLRYDEITRIVETGEYYFVYTGVRMAHILKKTDFTQGDAGSFGRFLEEKTGLTVVKGRA